MRIGSTRSPEFQNFSADTRLLSVLQHQTLARRMTSAQPILHQRCLDARLLSVLQHQTLARRMTSAQLILHRALFSPWPYRRSGLLG